jgi:peroxiredoxin Q/BCP
VLAKLKALNTEIVGCSGDKVETQNKFKCNNHLNFPLLADTDFKVVEAYGARRMKSFYGKSFLGIVRSTFWIGPDGKIRKIWPKVKVEGHAAEVLSAVQGAQEPAHAAAHR